MKHMLSVTVALMWLVALTTAEEEIPKCRGVTDEQMTKIKKMVVTEDIHNKLMGNFSQVYGPKMIWLTDSHTTVDFLLRKTDDKNIAYTILTHGDWFKGEKKREGTLHKVANGIYTMKRTTGEMKSMSYFLYSKGKVLAHFTCWVGEPAADSPDAKLPYLTGVETAERPMKPDTLANVEEANTMIKTHPELFGEIAYYNSFTPTGAAQ